MLKDALNLAGFVVLVILGALFINAFLFRTFAVVGPSMEPTFYTADRVVVSRLPHTASYFTRKPYVPDRGQIIVFENPRYYPGQPDQYVVKRVIGWPGERVRVADGEITIYNRQYPQGFTPDSRPEGKGPASPTSGNIDIRVPDGEIFVAGDNRIGNYSLDSRNGLGTIPLDNVIGPVVLQLFPFNQIRFF